MDNDVMFRSLANFRNSNANTSLCAFAVSYVSMGPCRANQDSFVFRSFLLVAPLGLPREPRRVGNSSSSFSSSPPPPPPPSPSPRRSWRWLPAPITRCPWRSSHESQSRAKLAMARSPDPLNLHETTAAAQPNWPKQDPSDDMQRSIGVPCSSKNSGRILTGAHNPTAFKQPSSLDCGLPKLLAALIGGCEEGMRSETRDPWISLAPLVDVEPGRAL